MNLKSPKVEGRKNERPLQLMNLKSPKVEGRNYATPPATTDEFEITEGRGAKIERPLQPINLKSPKVEGRNYATPDPQASPPSGNDFEQRFKEKRKGNEQRNGPARFSENSIRN